MMNSESALQKTDTAHTLVTLVNQTVKMQVI